MENLITNFQNPEFLDLFTMKITDAVMICTAADIPLRKIKDIMDLDFSISGRQWRSWMGY